MKAREREILGTEKGGFFFFLVCVCKCMGVCACVRLKAREGAITNESERERDPWDRKGSE